jgi:hypothetical protein
MAQKKSDFSALRKIPGRKWLETWASPRLEAIF